MKIAITSGKGGTGKTTISTGLFYMLTRYYKYNVQLLDCDAEEPDCHIFINARKSSSDAVSVSIPRINPEACTYCGKCKDVCAYQAIVMLPAAGFIEVVEDMCHGCGACSYVCPDKAIVEHDRVIGSITHYDYNSKGEFIEGRMNVGSALQTRVIRETISHADQSKLILYDAPPGTSCPVVAVVSKADYVVMVTEPTPFGLYDLRLMTDTVRQFGKKCGVIVNKAGPDYKPLYAYINDQNIDIIGEIPFRKEYARAYSRGEILPEKNNELKNVYIGIIKTILNGKTS